MITVLVTGFCAFPGARQNPSLALLTTLDKRRRRLARLGITLKLCALPVVYAGLGQRLTKLAETTRPDAIVHFGLAKARKLITVETQARNHVNLLRPDAAGAPPQECAVLSRRPEILKARLPAPQIVAALRRAGIASALSRDAGDYICNASLYHSLSACDATCIGFIHIPGPRHSMVRRSPHPDVADKDKRPSFAEVVTAAEIALILIARSVRQSRQTGSP
jgi:pyroglutamyl-peptidase